MIVAAAMLGGIPREAVQMAGFFFTTIAVIALGIPLIRGLTKRWDRPSLNETPPDVTARLERIEQAVEAVAIEVERIAEAQRFSAKLMAQKEPRALPKSDADR